jgi:hypothetical protein
MTIVNISDPFSGCLVRPLAGTAGRMVWLTLHRDFDAATLATVVTQISLWAFRPRRPSIRKPATVRRRPTRGFWVIAEERGGLRANCPVFRSPSRPGRVSPVVFVAPSDLPFPMGFRGLLGASSNYGPSARKAAKPTLSRGSDLFRPANRPSQLPDSCSAGQEHPRESSWSRRRHEQPRARCCGRLATALFWRPQQTVRARTRRKCVLGSLHPI